MTRQAYDRAPRLTKLATAHISKGDNSTVRLQVCCLRTHIKYLNFSDALAVKITSEDDFVLNERL